MLQHLLGRNYLNAVSKAARKFLQQVMDLKVTYAHTEKKDPTYAPMGSVARRSRHQEKCRNMHADIQVSILLERRHYA